jgi:hypothetical protein
MVTYLPAAQLVDVRQIDEGLVVQTLHQGSLDDLSAAMQAIDKFLYRYDLVAAGPRHEIYLSHTRRCLVEHQRTIIRVPVRAGP